MKPLTGRALVAAMCLGQVGNLLPHVLVPAVMAQHLMPLWGLTAAQAGLMASGYTFGYMLAVPLLTTVTDRIDARLVLTAGSALSGVATVMLATCVRLAPHKPPSSGPGHLLDLRPVLRNRAALGYILGYGAHSFELYGMRTWIVAFWTFIVAQSDGAAPIGPITVSVIVTLLSLPASILGNEAALRYGRHRAISAIMIASAAVALAIGFSVAAPPLLLLPIVLIYGLTVSADSGALTSGTTASAAPMQRGATLALHSTVGFGLAALGGWGAGLALDAAGGPATASGWLAVFVLLAAGILLGPVALWCSQHGK